MKRFDNRTVIVTAVHLLPAILLGAAACTSAPAQTPPAMDRAAAAPEAKAAVSAQWVRRAPLPERRFEVNATTDGRYLYLAGGFGPPAGGQLRTAPRTLWRYDPQADRWSRLTEIPQGVNHAPSSTTTGGSISWVASVSTTSSRSATCGSTTSRPAGGARVRRCRPPAAPPAGPC